MRVAFLKIKKNEIQSAKKYAAASIAYKPIHTEVRAMERTIDKIKNKSGVEARSCVQLIL